MFFQGVRELRVQSGISSIVVVTINKFLLFRDLTCSKAGCITVVANFLPKVDFSGDFSGDFCGVELRFSGFRVTFSGVFIERETVRIVAPLRRVVFVGVFAMISFDAVRGLTVRFLSSVLLTSIRRRA